MDRCRASVRPMRSAAFWRRRCEARLTNSRDNRAAIYLRSSKDRADVSPDAQRRALQTLASQRGLSIVAEFVDAAVSGKDSDRPGFRAMMDAVRNARRGWSTILIHDTARLVRGRYLAMIFEHEVSQHGVAVVYKSIPDSDPLTEMVVKSLFQAWDEWHSLNSKAKGLAGMAENVHAGFRAGGQAPTGYRLQRIETGTVRDGAAVVKTRLELDQDTADSVGRYLAARAEGMPRKRAKRAAGGAIERMPDNSLIGIEWNALTYAGHTVWRVAAERTADGYVGGSKRRPRSEWLIHRDTHPAMIDDAQAEAILTRLERRAADRRGNAGVTLARESGALLGGLLYAPDGRKWWSESDRYRFGRKGEPQRSITRRAIEDPVMRLVLQDLASPEFADRLLSGTRRAIEASTDPGELRRARDRVARLQGQVDRMLELAAGLEDPSPALRRVDMIERERADAAVALESAEAAAAAQRAIERVSAADVAAALGTIAERAQDADRHGLRAAILCVVDRVTLDPVSLTASIEYRIDASGVEMASPRRRERNPRPLTLHWSRPIGRITTAAMPA